MTVADNILETLAYKGADASAGSLGRLLELSASDTEAVSAVTQAISRDAKLTACVLEAANSEAFRHKVNEPVHTVTSAVMLLGLNTIRQLATALSLMDKLFEPEQRAAMHDELASAMLACTIAGKLLDKLEPADRDTAEVGTLVKGLGRLVAAAYAFNEFQDVAHRAKAGQDETEAAMAVLGATFDEIAQSAARHLGLSERYTDALSDPFCARVANCTSGLAQSLVEHKFELKAADVTAAMKDMAQSFSLPPVAVVQLTASARTEFEHVKAALKDRAERDTARSRSRQPSPPTAEPLPVAPVPAPSMALNGGSPADVMAQGVILLQKLGGYRNVLYCERVQLGVYRAVSATGACEAFRSRAWAVDVGAGDSILDLALKKGVSVHLGSAREDKIATRLPAWVRQSMGLPGSLLFVPMGDGRQVHSFIYCDKAESEAAVSDEVQAALRSIKSTLQLTLRNLRLNG